MKIFYQCLLCRSLYPLILILLVSIPLVSSCSIKKSASQNPAYNYVAEGRGTWVSSARGVNWDSTMAALEDAGYNMIFPNLCTGGAAFYKSEFLPMVGERDELALCIEAAHKYGIEVHVWRINWFMMGCPDSFTTRMEKEGRIQYSYDGKRNPEVTARHGYSQNRDWLCPSHPENRKLELEVMLEQVRNYDVDGVHFDYMRYGWSDMCYCDGCRERFAEESGLDMSNWPKDFIEGGRYWEAYLDWRRHLIHSSAREIAHAVHTYDPYVCVSLAARGGSQYTIDSDAQVWWEWIREGILDFVCPMNYTTEPDRFVALMKSHLPRVRGRIPYYSGVGMYRMKAYTPLKETVELGRGLGQDGFLTFQMRSLLPVLPESKAELTKQPALLPHRAPEIRFILEPSGRESEEGFAIYAPGDQVKFKASVMFKGKLKAGISRIRGDIVMQKITGETAARIQTLDLNKSSIRELSVACALPGRYRLAFYGTMTLSTGEEKPFIARSFPFEVGSGMSVTWPDRIVRGANISIRATEEDIAHYAREWNGYAVRILVNSITDEEPPYAVSEERKARVFGCLDLCLKYGLLTVFSPSASFRDNDKFFSNQQWLAAFKDFWREVATRYKDKGPIVYDLINEPWGDKARLHWSNYAKELTAAIREIDTLHTIMVVPPEWGWPNGFQYLEPTGDKNTVYSLHFYGPMDFTHQRNKGHMRTTEQQWRERVYPGFLQGEEWDKERLRKEVQKAARWRDRYGVRMWCGEFGVARWARGAYRWTTDWIDVLEEEKIGWAYYVYRGWQHMDMEMDSTSRQETPRTETDVARLYKSYFTKTE